MATLFSMLPIGKMILSFKLPILRVGYFDTRATIGVPTDIVGSSEEGHALRCNLKSGNFKSLKKLA